MSDLTSDEALGYCVWLGEAGPLSLNDLTRAYVAARRHAEYHELNVRKVIEAVIRRRLEGVQR